ncbi:MAG: MFS transporter [Henriciella sp.]|nr:MFS transporter [Henriciella sp.]
MDTSPKQSQLKTILAGFIGNVAEWYDFAVYGYFAAVIGPLFFPSDNPALSLIAAFGAFAAGFIVRPMGAIVFGYIGDKLGRAKALFLSLAAMAVPTIAIGLLPTYEAIGIAAPILLVLLRMVQGLSVGGEYTSSIVYLVEQAPVNRRAFIGSWSKVGATTGVLVGSAVGAIFTYFLDDAQISSWGWRVPFLLGFVVALAGILFRRAMAAEPKKEILKNPVKTAFANYWRLIFKVTAMKITLGVGFYGIFVYAVTYIREIDGFSATSAFQLNLAAMLALVTLLPLASILSDRIGRKPLLLAGSGTLAFGGIPLFFLIHSTSPMTVLMGEVGFAIGIAMFSAGATATVVELVPSETRCTVVAIAHNTAMALFGGTTPLIAAWLLTSTGDPIAPGYWIAGASLFSFFAILTTIPETRGRTLA